MADIVTIPAGVAIPAPPAGTGWMFARAHTDGRLELTTVPHIAGSADPTPPTGCTWRAVDTRGARVHIAIPQPFLHHPLARAWQDEV